MAPLRHPATPENAVERLNASIFTLGENLRVDIRRGAEFRVAEHPGYFIDVEPGSSREGVAYVPEVMNPNNLYAGLLTGSPEAVAQAPRSDRLSDSVVERQFRESASEP